MIRSLSSSVRFDDLPDAFDFVRSRLSAASAFAAFSTAAVVLAVADASSLASFALILSEEAFSCILRESSSTTLACFSNACFNVSEADTAFCDCVSYIDFNLSRSPLTSTSIFSPFRSSLAADSKSACTFTIVLSRLIRSLRLCSSTKSLSFSSGITDRIYIRQSYLQSQYLPYRRHTYRPAVNTPHSCTCRAWQPSWPTMRYVHTPRTVSCSRNRIPFLFPIFFIEIIQIRL